MYLYVKHYKLFFSFVSDKSSSYKFSSFTYHSFTPKLFKWFKSFLDFYVILGK